MQEAKKIWMDGKMVNWGDAQVHVLSHALHYGSAVFEGIRCYQTANGTAVFRLKEHLQRLFFSAKCLGMRLPFSFGKMAEAVLETLRVNDLKEGYIRPLVFYGSGKMGLSPLGAPVRVVVAAWPRTLYLKGDPSIIKIKTSRFIRIHPRSSVMEAKISGHYVNSILASLETQKEGFDEALFLDYKGHVAEGPGENIFWVKKGTLFTPPLGFILPGITRKTVLTLSRDLGLKKKEKNIVLKDLKLADEVFFTGTAVEIVAIGQIDQSKINQGRPGPVTEKIKQSYFKAVRGEDRKHAGWITLV